MFRTAHQYDMEEQQFAGNSMWKLQTDYQHTTLTFDIS